MKLKLDNFVYGYFFNDRIYNFQTHNTLWIVSWLIITCIVIEFNFAINIIGFLIKYFLILDKDIRFNFYSLYLNYINKLFNYHSLTLFKTLLSILLLVLILYIPIIS